MLSKDNVFASVQNGRARLLSGAAQLLAALGYTVETACDGKEAAVYLRKSDPLSGFAGLGRLILTGVFQHHLAVLVLKIAGKGFSITER
jgi:hypothetical protein